MLMAARKKLRFLYFKDIYDKNVFRVQTVYYSKCSSNSMLMSVNSIGEDIFNRNCSFSLFLISYSYELSYIADVLSIP